ncbi:dihydroxy-acid dehydratase [Mesorhizobium sp.]|uniref:dihydroxy-acid dehydratase domain-containing protein n=1 Tax=Mesorhizobium sp. TaxID=1871066 RepID=UPI00338F916A
MVRDGDMISLDASEGLLDLLVGADELDRRKAPWVPPAPHSLRAAAGLLLRL